MYIFAKDRNLIDHLTTNISSGTVLVNDTNIHFANSCLPFGVSDRAALVLLMERLALKRSRKREVSLDVMTITT